ncbi:MAG TPA: hypothetical protein VER36_08130 [Flavisolibacter sp.]|nr:hypothetical protein [Flavisolibacter sp.]
MVILLDVLCAVFELGRICPVADKLFLNLSCSGYMQFTDMLHVDSDLFEKYLSQGFFIIIIIRSVSFELPVSPALSH